LLFPWRTSAVLVPLATAIILARLVGMLANRTGLESYPTCCWAVCSLTLGVFFAAGVAISLLGLGYRSNPDEIPLLEFVRPKRETDDGPSRWPRKTVKTLITSKYLLPVEWPKLDTGNRGAASTNFIPAPRAGKSGHLIAIDLQRFRIFTGAPIYVDFKSIPYKDSDVVEWHRRLLWAHKLYTEQKWNDEQTLLELWQSGITFVITTGRKGITGPDWERFYEDRNYRVYWMLR